MEELLNNCNGCSKMELPFCFSNMELTSLDSGGSYVVVFTNHFGSKKRVEVTANYSGIVTIAVAELPEGYFTPYGDYTLEVFPEGENCIAVEICGKPCVGLHFYEGEAETVTIECCGTSGCCDNYIEVETVEDVEQLYDDAKFNYIVSQTTFDNGNQGLLYLPLTAEMLNPGGGATIDIEELLESELVYFLSCDVDILLQGAAIQFSDDCDCTMEAATTVGDIDTTADGQLFLFVQVNIGFTRAAVALLLDEEVINQLNSLPPETPLLEVIGDSVSGDGFEGPVSFKFMKCATELLLPTEPAMRITEVTFGASGCAPNQVDVEYTRIPAGSALVLYALMGGVETVITGAIAIEGTAVIFVDYSPGQMPEGLEIDEGVNYIKAIITLPDMSALVDMEAVGVPVCV